MLLLYVTLNVRPVMHTKCYINDKGRNNYTLYIHASMVLITGININIRVANNFEINNAYGLKR